MVEGVVLPLGHLCTTELYRGAHGIEGGAEGERHDALPCGRSGADRLQHLGSDAKALGARSGAWALGVTETRENPTPEGSGGVTRSYTSPRG